MDGAVYEWDSFNGKRVGESVLKSCSYTGVAVTPDGKTNFAAGSDKTLKEIADSQVQFWDAKGNDADYVWSLSWFDVF